MPAFTARAGRVLLERVIAVAARRAAAPGGIRFTERQLYYEARRVLRPAPAPGLSRFTEALRGREPAGLLPAADPPGPVTSGQAREPDLYAYGLPRLLVCQDRSIARMLLANHVHLEAACPVLAAQDCLPLDPRLVAALERAGDATVHVLHDASPTGIALPARVRETLPSVRVASLGLVPRHVAALRLVSGRGPRPAPPVTLPPGLRRAEADWLAAGRYAEVAAVPPAQLLRAVLRLTRGPRPARPSARGELRELRTAGFLTWPGA
ncbi:hypothetical protein SRB5_07790 [Streptomyces sp. RB5]|uniref:Uncharacterized protein n=1 Tax=Streptomyces smaragdinus TaxID=2585196 RepID=A0A7K0CB31_9ACTN|nr:hypothetical protein [Streptomyces smaragdinus]MQY10667.1 hypothetical protein [Streptomyces smaragdinus]